MWRSGLEASLGHCSSPLGYLERQAFSFEVRSQSCQNLKLKPGLWGELAFWAPQLSKAGSFWKAIKKWTVIYRGRECSRLRT